MYLSYTCHKLLYTYHSLVYPVIHQLYFESIFPYLWGTSREVSDSWIWLEAHPKHIAWFSGVGIWEITVQIVTCVNGYIKVYLKDVTGYTAYILVYTRYIYCQTPPLLWIRLCRPCDADWSQPHAPCLLRSLRPASRISSQHSDHPGGACHEQNSSATG